MTEISTATLADVDEIVACTNEAFMADSFFKKPDYHLRFTPEDVTRMVNGENATFLLIHSVTNGVRQLAGSAYLSWEFIPNNSEPLKYELHGKFSAVAVASKFEKRGIGKSLIAAMETHLLDTVRNQSELKDSVAIVSMEMGVINLRKDLFPWYEKQGYTVVGEIRPNDAEVSRIILDDLDVCCVLMRKVLVDSV
jgi:ribosomal protein S18 acetylase RimI-like enzyme